MSVSSGARIALITSSYFPEIGGVESHVQAMASLLPRRGHAVEVWTVEREGAYRVEEIDGVRVRYLPAPLPASSPSALARFAGRVPAAWRHWATALREFTPDLLHVHCFGPNGVYALGLNTITRTPLIVTSHGETLGDDDGVYARSALLRMSLRAGLSRAKTVTAPSSYVLDDLTSRFGLRGGEVVRNGVYTGVDIAPRSSASRSSAPPYLFAVGRLGVMKGFDLLIEAFDRADLGSDVSLVIAGNGPELQTLKSLVSQRALTDRVAFRGWITPSQVAEEMVSALGVVVPSRSEAFGIVALEAWRARSALIMTSRGGAREFVNDRTDALVVDPLNIEALAAAIREVATDSTLRESLRTAGHARVHEFDWSKVADDYERIYTDVPARERT